MWRTAFTSTLRLTANRSSIVWAEHRVRLRTYSLCGLFSYTSSSFSPFWSTASSQAPSAGANPLGTPFSEVRDGGRSATDEEKLMMSMAKMEPRSTSSMLQISPLEARETSKLLDPRHEEERLIKKQIGDNLSRRDKCKFLLDMFAELKDSKEAVYGTLDAWVAWERQFPLAAIRRTLFMLEKDEQWHRIIQVIKWMLSKGQGNTMGTYEQLIRALEKDNRPEEAHNIWVRKCSYALHSAPWTACDLMISIYYRNNMLERLVKLFKKLEVLGRKPPKKSIVRKVADAYEVQGLLDEKHKVMEKYIYLFQEPTRKLSSKSHKKSNKAKNDGKTGVSSNVSQEDANAL